MTSTPRMSLVTKFRTSSADISAMRGAEGGQKVPESGGAKADLTVPGRAGG